MLTINERLLHFIWQFQYFNRLWLLTTHDEPVTIIHQGHYNTNQGPDFLDARIRINDTLWAGQIELHIQSSDWDKHQHSLDPNYDNVILHVVWRHDKPVYDSKGGLLPTLELQSLTAVTMLQQYETLMQSREFIACNPQSSKMSALSWLSWKERLVTERYERKAAYILQLFEETGNHWEEVFWWMIARNFGIKVNAEVFESIAKTIPINVLAKSKYQLHQIEAMLFGQANLLGDDEAKDEYTLLLKKEYIYLKAKYSLSSQTLTPSFLRMRPANFPSIRLAQLAMLIHQSKHLFSIVRDSKEAKEVCQLFDITAGTYWDTHYRLGEESVTQAKRLGGTMINNIMINTVGPVLFAYGKYLKDDSIKEKALKWIEYIPAEQNNITVEWINAGVYNRSALDSQALLELYKHYCQEKRCLECTVGNKILKLAKAEDGTLRFKKKYMPKSM